MKIDANGSKPHQPVHLIRIVETMTPTLPKVSYLISWELRHEDWTYGKDVKEDTTHIVRMGVIVSM